MKIFDIAKQSISSKQKVYNKTKNIMWELKSIYFLLEWWDNNSPNSNQDKFPRFWNNGQAMISFILASSTVEYHFELEWEETAGVENCHLWLFLFYLHT